ncbi:hypothetical protein PGUG_04168 [Meyerozyma guilliermondii ATCC 6260]|uniref:Pre-rRNA-processing protein RIX1 n=1 Tax=Meyerozyma guilliermondii (strain ATCC 6260 / CBS 566 / DSM 6381 / JCM 1539 / NBRC 10279 / NRRL Y-324) TaxID=294746 RepID=RIX1_PICGU|nr:uncharacterized protein PGUG_04168 [Meyerozyma guilliermondii ATCC 6260]A5DLL7.2 RecName: Full=Pre-rRNA-processing protein RIX1 [Meyerozyma guilliermondii ATCC 6260]EDK40070.2 hypothetical protein PGUG_04168 [Meyerozyma guilliermondii ATCC 6260]
MLPLAVILSELQEPKTIVPVLSSLRSGSPVWSNISGPDQKHLVSRTLNLTRSSIQFRRWFGINVIRVLADNYKIMAGDGSQIIGQLLKLLEQCNQFTSAVYFKSLVECIDHVCDSIRGKPTMTRELLTPNLPAIIGLYLEKFSHDPAYLVSRLAPYIRAHPTTFRPFGNKLRSKIMETILSPAFSNFPDSSKDIFCNTLSTLCAVEKIEPEERWSSDLFSLIGELSNTLEIYGEFLNFEDDAELGKLLKKIPRSSSGESEFPSLSIDINDPSSFYSLPERLDILLRLIRGYLSAPTSFVAKVPLGIIALVVEAVLSINSRFIPFKREIRDESTKQIIRNTLQCAHSSALGLLKVLPSIFRGSLVPYMRRILGLLETLIPMKKKSLDTDQIVANEQFICLVLDCVACNISLVSYYQDSTGLVRLIDAAMAIVQPRSSSNTSSNTANTISSNGKKKKKQASVPLADVLSHQHLFNISVSESTTNHVQSFVNTLISCADLPSAQHNKVCKFVIVEAVKASHHIQEGTVPKQLRNLLVNAVLHPGFETTSILPIVCSILKEDELLSVFRNPRFPPVLKAVEVKEEEEEEEEEEESEEEPEEAEEAEEVVNGSRTEREVAPETKEVEPENKRRKIEIPEAVSVEPQVSEPQISTSLQHSISNQPEPAEPKNLRAPEPVKQANNPKLTEPSAAKDLREDFSDDSDFEMPEIDVDSDDE